MSHPVQVVLLLAGVGEGDVDEGHNGRRQLVAVGELELEGGLLGDRLRQALGHHLVDDFLLRLRVQRKRKHR